MRNLEKWEPFVEPRGPAEAWGVRTAGEGPKVIIPATHRLDGEDADLICRTHNARLKSRPEQVYYKAISSSETRQPVYQFQVCDTTWEMDLFQLRDFISELYELAESGITDCFIVKWVTTRLVPDAPPDEQRTIVVGMLEEFRAFRDLLREPLVEADEGAAAS